MKRLSQFVLAITSACTALSLSIFGGIQNLPVHGSSEGSSFSIGCGDGKALIGLKGKKGMFLGKLEGLCKKLSTEGKWLGSTTDTAATGGGGYVTPIVPQPFTITCPRDTVVRGMSGRHSEDFIVRINLHCQPLGPSGLSPAVVTVDAMPSGNVSSWSLEVCDTVTLDAAPLVGHPGRGFHGRFTTAGIRAIGLVCHAGTTPNTETLAPPDELAAVNLVGATGPPANAVTPFVQLSWMDRSTYESGFLVRVFRGGTMTNTFERPAGTGIDSRQAVNIIDLPGGNYTFNVCSKYSANDGGNLCFGNTPFQIALAPTCSPTITSVVQRGAGTGEVRWTHTCTNPTNFVIRAISGNTVFTPIVTPNGTAREETFSFQNGINSEVRVCAVFPNQGDTSFCSAPFPFLFSGV